MCFSQPLDKINVSVLYWQGLSGSKVLKYKIAISQNNDCNCFCIKTLKLLHEKYKILDVGYAAEVFMIEETKEKSC